MRGSGKSTVGKKLARKLNLQFYDSDKILEEREALSIVDIHDFMGERYFQQKEEEVIKEIIYKHKDIILTADFIRGVLDVVLKNSLVQFREEFFQQIFVVIV